MMKIALSMVYITIFISGLMIHDLLFADQNIRYFSQFKQDEYVNTHFFKNKPNGIFLDIGAHDGVSFNNSVFF